MQNQTEWLWKLIIDEETSERFKYENLEESLLG